MNRLQKTKEYFLFFLCMSSALIVFRSELTLLFRPDAEKQTIYTHSFHDLPLSHANNIIKHGGFITDTQGLQLASGSAGTITFSFNKKPGQGCLLRIWFYGDGGEMLPNAIKMSTDYGNTFQEIAGSGNYIGTVFDLSDYSKGSDNFQLLFEAENHAPFTSVIIDKIEVVIFKGYQTRSPLPNLPLVAGCILLLWMILYLALKEKFNKGEMVRTCLLAFIFLMAIYLRWNELTRVSGTILDGDAEGYLNFAKRMNLFDESGFYSARFSLREPLYIFMVKMFFMIFGVSDTHLRFVSFTFSLAMIFLTYRIGKEWFNSVVGLSAALIMTVHPYLIILSARGLRAEWFTTLLLLFVYYGYVKKYFNPNWRVIVCGFLAGAILLTRSECSPMIVIIMMTYPFLARIQWNYKMILLTLIIGISLWIPHLYGTYKEHGDPFYPMNRHARFYANRDFAGTPGFPTKEEIAEKGMYTGPKITPLEYYFKFHTPWQLLYRSLVGFTCIHVKMPFHFATGKGNLRKIKCSLNELRESPGSEQIVRTFKLCFSILIKDIWDYSMSFVILALFLIGLILIGYSRQWIFFLYVISFQIQTSFLAYRGLDQRLSIHSYPLIALCCGYSIYWFYQYLSKKGGYYSTQSDAIDNSTLTL